MKSFNINDLFGISNLDLDTDARLLSETVCSLFVLYRNSFDTVLSFCIFYSLS